MKKIEIMEKLIDMFYEDIEKKTGIDSALDFVHSLKKYIDNLCVDRSIVVEDMDKRGLKNIKLIASKEFIESLINAGSLDNLEDLEQMPDEEYEKAVKYWQENFFNDGDYSQEELKEYFKNNHHGVIFKIEDEKFEIYNEKLYKLIIDNAKNIENEESI